MLITIQSNLTGKHNTMDLPVTAERVKYWQQSGELIQRVFPNLSPDQREFLMTGATPEEWDALIGPEEDYDIQDEDAPPF